MRRRFNASRAAWETAAGSALFNPRDLPQLTAWLSWAGATDTGTLSVPDLMGGSPATQATGALKPTINTTSNGVKYGTFSAHTLVLPLSAAINGNTKFGIEFWLRLANTTGVKAVASVQNVAGGASADKLLINAFGGSLQARAQSVDRRATASSIDTNWRHCYIGIDCGQGTEATQVLMYIDGVATTVSFSNDTAWPATMGTPTGNMLIGSTLANGTGSPLVADIADVRCYSDQLTAADVGRLMNFNRPL